MADPKGFLKVKRQKSQYRPVCERVKDYCEVNILRTEEHSKEQASRCMDCGTSFCHWGCPVSNLIPEWNDSVFNGQWRKAFKLLQSINNLPEITGRICPAICEYACVLGINDEPVTIRENELSIIEHAFKKGFIKPNPPKKRTGKTVAIIGSGPAGLSCADELNKRGHNVFVFERDDKIGGILRYGIPDFKLEKWIIDRRIDIFKKEGIKFKTGINVGVDYPVKKLLKEFDAVCLTSGSRVPRDLKIDGRELKGIYFAMDFLIQANRIASGERINAEKLIDARGKKVIVIGGGDTGADCVGVANRQGAKTVVQIELLQCPPEKRTSDYPWPKYPILLKTSTSHEEGCKRLWAVLTKKFTGENGRVKAISCIKLDFSAKDQKGCLPKLSDENRRARDPDKHRDSNILKEIPGTEFEIEADLVILALGFLHPEKKGLLEELKIELDNRGNVKTGEKFMTSRKGVFSAGDMRRGQSLIVWAIYEGRKSAKEIDEYLMR